MKTLVVGWFSFESGHATAGDLIDRDLVCDWLVQAGFPYDVAVAPPFNFPGGVDLSRVDPAGYSQVVFVCGPFDKGELEAQLLNSFGHCRLVGVSLSMQLPLEEWNPFDVLIERDSTHQANPDIAFLTHQLMVPIVGICLVESHEGAWVETANAAVQELTASREMGVVQIDTRLDQNSTGLRSPAEIESIIARMDALVTTRLHGLVLALKNGVPVVAIDPVPGGGKIRHQARTIGWPVLLPIDQLTPADLQQALTYCLTEEAKRKAAECRELAIHRVEQIRSQLISTLRDETRMQKAHAERVARMGSERFIFKEPESEPISPGNWRSRIFTWLNSKWARRLHT